MPDFPISVVKYRVNCYSLRSCPFVNLRQSHSERLTLSGVGGGSRIHGGLTKCAVCFKGMGNQGQGGMGGGAGMGGQNNMGSANQVMYSFL